MLKSLLGSVFGTRHERVRKRVQPIVDDINEHYARLQSVSEDELTGQTARFRTLIEARTSAIRGRIVDLREQKRLAADPEAREAIDRELGGGDGQGAAGRHRLDTGP